MPIKIEHDGKEVEVYFREELEAEVEKEVKGLKVTNENLKAEKAEIKDKLKEEQESKRQIEEAKAKAEGDKETLERLQAERESEAQERYNALVNETKTEKINNGLNSIIMEVGAGGDKSKDLLDLVKVRHKLDFDTESKEYMIDGERVSSLDKLKESIVSSGRYDGYLKPTGASGGSSQGGQGAGSTTEKSVNRSEFDGMSQQDRAAFIKDGGKVTDEA